MSHRKSRSRFSADGHTKFEDARNPHLAEMKMQNLAEAEGLYQKCLESSKTSDEKASACKKLFELKWWVAKDVWNSGKAESVDKRNEGTESLQKCVEYVLRAQESILCSKGVEEWVSAFIRWSSELLDADPASFTPVMAVVCKALATSKWGAERYVKIVSKIIAHAVPKYLEIESSSSRVPGQGGCEQCMQAMLKCQEILKLRCIENNIDRKKVEDLMNVALRHIDDCKAIQYSIIGEDCLEKFMKGEKEMIISAIDNFKNAVNTGHRSEYRAFAYSRLGILYSLDGDERKAHHNHNRSVEIGRRNLLRVKSAGWYISSCEAVEKHLMEETEGKVTGLEEAAKNAKNLMSFIKYLFENLPHPTKEKPQFLSSKVLVTNKSAWYTAARTYHPDKNKQESKYWLLLCEAIMTELNKKKPL